MTTATLTRPSSKSVGASVRLTLDEARLSVVRSAVDCLRRARCGPRGLLAMLRGLPGGEGWDSDDELLAVEHRRVLEKVLGAGHGWVIEEQLEGIVSATGVDEGFLRNVDSVASQIPSDEDDRLDETD